MQQTTESSGRWARTVALTAVVVILTSTGIGYLGYRASRAVVFRTAASTNLTIARTIRNLAGDAFRFGGAMRPSPEAVAALWHDVVAPHPDSFLCIIDDTGRIVLNTNATATRSLEVGDVALPSQGPGTPRTVGELLARQGDWAGRNVSLRGVRQVVAYAYVPELRGLVVVHTPEAALSRQLRATVTPWLLGVALIGGLLFPAALFLLHRSFSSAESKATRHIEALRESEGRLHAALMASGTGTFRWTLESGELDCDEGLHRLLGLAPRSLRRADDLRQRIHPGDLEEFDSAVRGCVDDRAELEVEFRIVHPDGSLRWLRGIGACLPGIGDAPDFIAGACVDVTELKQLDHERDVLGAERRQHHKLESIRTFAKGVAHEFRNALMVISGNTALIRRSLPEGHEAMASLENIDQAALGATRVISSMMAYAGADSRNAVPLDLADAIRSWVERSRPMLPGDVVVETTFTSPEIWIEADPEQIDTALGNLIRNSIDAMPGGGRIEIAAGVVEDKVALRVQDTGSGMDPETRARAFDPFFTTKARGEATGLGLSIVYGIVSSLRGTVRIDSRPGRGTDVWIMLPSSAVRPARAPDAVRAAAAGNRALVAADNAIIRSIVVSALESAQLDVVRAETGDEIVRICREHQDVHLAILDLGLLSEDEQVALHQLSADRSAIATIVMTDHEGPPLADPSYANRYILRKPFRVSALLKTIDRVLEGSRSGLRG